MSRHVGGITLLGRWPAAARRHWYLRDITRRRRRENSRGRRLGETIQFIAHRPSLTLNAFVDFFSMYRYMFGSRNTQTDLTVPDAQHGHDDVIANDQGFANNAGQYKHCAIHALIIDFYF
ncbi:heme exporter protein D [Rhodanobacter sp. K2T2]|nr:heme exporter protein D [Rhodanobacter sp. K2T2]